MSIAVIVLTYNEEDNLPHALNSVKGFADEVIVVDSFSTDGTAEIANKFGARFVQHRFENYGKQRNFALSVDVTSDWIFFLDADEQIPPELWRELRIISEKDSPIIAYYVRFRLMWMGKWVRRGLYPTWIARFFKKGRVRCEERSVNEHLIFDGPSGKLENDLIHENHSGIDRWVLKHIGYADKEAAELLRAATNTTVRADLFGTQPERKRWIKSRVWDNLPPLLRPVSYFFYRYVLRGGFLDGKEALSFHVLQALWFQMLIDMRYLELKRNAKAPEESSRDTGK